MDLLGDIGAEDQLASARAENKVLKEKVEQLEKRCKILTVENETLKAEVEMYRKEYASTAASSSVDGDGDPAASHNNNNEHDLDHFIRSGDGIYAKIQEVELEKLHGISNPSCCSLSNDDTLVGTGGADQQLSLCQWGAALDGKEVVGVSNYTSNIPCGAPVISVDFARNKPRSPFCAAGCMDGSVHVIYVDGTSVDGLQAKEIASGTIKHSKYVRTVVWSHDGYLLASASADGSVQIHKVIWDGFADFETTDSIQLEKVEALSLTGPVESMCFHKNFLVCYARGTPYLSYFDMGKDFEHTKRNLNQGPGSAGFRDQVSFAVMDMVPHGPYLALATDTNRNIIIEFETGKHIRNLYGHQNDEYSQPKVAWSQNGQYLYGNTQGESSIVVWDIASATIVKRLDGQHLKPIRDLYSSQLTNTLVTTSFDKKTLIWLASSTDEEQ